MPLSVLCLEVTHGHTIEFVMVTNQSPKRTSNRQSFSPELQPMTLLFISNHHKWLEVSMGSSQSNR